MPIAKTKTLTDKKAVEIVRPEVLPPPKPLPVDTAYTPRRVLLTYIAGSKWKVTYYKQLKTKEEAAEPFDYRRPAPYQQYIKINNFEIKVTSPLSSNPDNDNASMTLIGSGIIYPSIVPNHGDHFIADIGDGRSGFFHVKEVTQKSHLRDTVFEIEYELMFIVNEELLEKLHEKVVQENYYVRDYTQYGGNPVLGKQEWDDFQYLSLWNERIARHYFHQFFNNEHRTFLIPLKDTIVYDPYVVEFLQRLWPTDLIPELSYMRVYARDTDKNRFDKTVWDAIIENDPYILKTCSTEFGILPRRFLRSRNANIKGVGYSSLPFIYHPIRYNRTTEDVVINGTLTIKLPELYREYNSPRILKLPLKQLGGFTFGYNPPNIEQDAKKLSTFETYVFSPSFYRGEVNNMAVLEKLTYQLLQGESLDVPTVRRLAEACIDWGEVEQFYYIPVLVAISKVALGDLSQ